MKTGILIVALVGPIVTAPSALAFEGRIQAALSQGSQITPLLYTVGANQLRIEVAATNRTNPADIVDLQSGAVTLLFPHNRSFVRLNNDVAGAAVPVPAPATVIPSPGMPTMPPGMPTMPPGTPAMPPGMPAMPPGMSTMPMMPMPSQYVELKATGETTNLLGYSCARYEIKQRMDTMVIWATDILLPFRPYLQNQPHRFGPRMIEEQWPALMTSHKLFPLLVMLRTPSGAERFHFEVTAITPGKITDPDGTLFQPPANYHELQPLPR